MLTKLKNNVKITNEYGEKLDALIEGKADANATIVFVHGLGTNKNEGQNLFGDLASALGKEFRALRFDLSGCGASEGNEEESNLHKWSRDLSAVVDYVKSRYDGEVDIIAHSFGTFVTTALSPQHIRKAVFIAMANKDTSGDSIKERIKSRGGTLNEQGISVYQRSTGEVQRIGPSFWQELAKFNPVSAVSAFSSKTSLTIIEPNQDEVVKKENREGYESIANLHYIKLDGGHDFAGPKDREALIRDLVRLFDA